MTQLKLLARLVISTAAGIGAAVVAALVIAVVDLYVTGHGYGSLRREVITWNPASVHLSFGDLGSVHPETPVLQWRVSLAGRQLCDYRLSVIDDSGS